MTHLPPGFALAFLLWYYAFGLVCWVCNYVFASDDFGYRSIQHIERDDLLLVFVTAIVWPGVLVAFVVLRRSSFRMAGTSVDVNSAVEPGR